MGSECALADKEEVEEAFERVFDWKESPCLICQDILGSAPCVKVCDNHIFHGECI